MTEGADPILTALMRLEAGQERLGRTMSADLVQLQTGLERLEAAQATTRIDLMARLDRMQNTVTDIRDDITVNYAIANHATLSSNNTREEIRAVADIQRAMLRQIQRLQNDVKELRGKE